MGAKEAPYGLWESSISLDSLASDVSTLDDVIVDPVTQKIYLLEGRSIGRNVLVELADGKTRDVLPKPYSIGTMVYGYGGSAMGATSDSKIIFADKKNGFIHSLDPKTGDIQEIFNDPDFTYCDFHGSAADARWMLALQEEHKDPTPATEKHSVCALDLVEKKAVTLVEGADFYWAARFSPKGDRICWLSWNHPNMPWQGCSLHVADFADGAISNTKFIAGSPEGRAILEPRWGVDGSLYFTDDVSGHSQPQVLRPSAEAPVGLDLPGLDGVEFIGGNLMRMGCSSYQLLSQDLGIFTYMHKAECNIIAVNLKTNEVTDLGLSFAMVLANSMRALNQKEFVFIATTKTEPQSLYKATIEGDTAKLEVLRRSTEMKIPKEVISIPKAMTCPRTRGADLDGVVHFFYMPPTNPEFKGPANSLPPLIVYCHGGPTGLVTPALWLDFQYWTSRGYAALLLNYAGSVGYGRDYRAMLDGKWGIIDSADAASAVDYLADEGYVDRSKVGIYGLSAGGYLVLKAMCDFPDVWAGGVSLFGVTDTKLLAEKTHKFESRYLDRLMFPSGPDADQKEQDVVNFERSPVNLTKSINCPLLQLQGTADIVVPPDQAQMMEDRLKENKKEAETVWFPGEGHSVWKGEAMKKSMGWQEKWWKKTLVRQAA